MPDPSCVVHVVDDDPSFRAAIAALLSACGYRVALYESARQLLEALPSGSGCILLDLQMPGSSGTQLQDRLAELGNRLPIVFLTGHGEIATSVQAIKAGAEDFLTKPVAKAQLLAAIDRAIVRCEETRQRDDRSAALRSLISRLTPRERDVFALLVRGRPHKQIAFALGTSERTVKMHRHSVMHKCEVQSPAELAVIADRLGMLTPAAAPGDQSLERAGPRAATTSGPSSSRHS
jgi:FixJ family two-component response regulator